MNTLTVVPVPETEKDLENGSQPLSKKERILRRISNEIEKIIEHLDERELIELFNGQEYWLISKLPMHSLYTDWLFKLCNDTGLAAMSLTAESGLKDANELFQNQFWYAEKDIAGQHICMLLADKERHGDVAISMQQALSSGESYIYEGQLIRSDASLFWWRLWIKNIHPGNPKKGAICIVKDITMRRKELEQRILDQKTLHSQDHDPRTGLFNGEFLKKYMEEMLPELEKSNEKAAILYIDLDNFKEINEVIGRDAGDELLQQVGQRLQSTLRASDLLTKLARSWGDEFVIVWSISSHEDGKSLAQRLLEAFKAPFTIDQDSGEKRTITISPSIGVSIYPQDGKNYNRLLGHAEIAMYHSKGRGGSGFTEYTPQMWVNIYESLRLENDILRALENNEFVLYYQPQVNVKSGTLKWVEALIRWNHPERWMLTPSNFMPFSEKRKKLVTGIGLWVIEAACKQSVEWKAKKLNCKIAVNFSTWLFRIWIVEDVQRILAETGADPSMIEIEVTEGALENTEETKQILGQFKEMGLSISIDDFGTGYSCLAHLSKFPIDTLKIDKAFIDELHKDGLPIVQAIIGMAKSLNMKVIAEWVEEKSQAEILLWAWCDEIQGFFFSKPIASADLEELMKKKHTWSVK